MTDKPSPGTLWEQAGGGTPGYDPQRYHDLLAEHGHILRPGDEGYEQGSRTLPCGRPGPQRPAEEWCIHELPGGTCSVCTGRGEEPAPGLDISALGGAFRARYDGKCAWCGDPFAEGDRIRYDYAGGYVAACCWETP